MLQGKSTSFTDKRDPIGSVLLTTNLFIQVIEVVCCKLTELQENLYNHFLTSKATRNLVSGKKSAGVLSAITNLKKLCNHPKLIYDGMHHVDKDKGPPEGFEVLLRCSCFGSENASLIIAASRVTQDISQALYAAWAEPVADLHGSNHDPCEQS